MERKLITQEHAWVNIIDSFTYRGAAQCASCLRVASQNQMAEVSLWSPFVQFRGYLYIPSD